MHLLEVHAVSLAQTPRILAGLHRSIGRKNECCWEDAVLHHGLGVARSQVAADSPRSDHALDACVAANAWLLTEAISYLQPLRSLTLLILTSQAQRCFTAT
jgi:hypothetical protein